MEEETLQSPALYHRPARHLFHNSCREAEKGSKCTLPHTRTTASILIVVNSHGRPHLLLLSHFLGDRTEAILALNMGMNSSA